MKPQIEFRHLRAFQAVSQELHFTRAATRLHLAQQALSAQIRQLETELGVELFHRTTRSVELTTAGDTLHAHVQRLLAGLDAAIDETRRAATGDSGRLTLGYTPTVAQYALPTILEGVTRRLPQLKVIAVETWTRDAVSAVAERRFDVALARSALLEEGVRSLAIRHEPLGVVLGIGHRLAGDERLSVEALAADTLAIWPRDLSPGFFDQVMSAFPGHAARGPIHEFANLAHETFIADVVSRMEIAAGRAFYPTFETHFKELPPGFVWRPLDSTATVAIDLLYRDDALLPAVRAFVDAVVDVAVECSWVNGARFPA